MNKSPDWFNSLLEAASDHDVSIAEPATPPRDVWWETPEMLLHGLDWGRRGKPDLFCLHGGAQQAHTWDFFALAARAAFHVRSLDLRGHGDSDWASGQDYSLDTIAADVRQVRTREASGEVVLMGLSLGGLAALSYAGTWQNEVRALVIVDVSMDLGGPGVKNLRNFMTGPERFQTLEELVDRVHAFNPKRPKHQLRNSLMHNLRRGPDGRWTWKYDPAFRGGMDPSAVVDTNKVLTAAAQITAPTLIVRGADSDVLSEEGVTMLSEAIPHADVEVVPGAGHSVMGDNPRGFQDKVLAWLDASVTAGKRPSPGASHTPAS